MTFGTFADSAQTRALALDLEASGQFREAIDVWMVVNRHAAEAEIEQRLVRLRHEAASSHDPSAHEGSAREPWPRPLADPFPHVYGEPPETEARGLTSELLGGAIQHHGCLLVRGFLEARRARQFVDLIDAAFEAREAHLSGTPTERTAPWFAPDPDYDAVGPPAALQRALNHKLNAMLAVDSPRGLFEIIDALEARGVPDALRGYFGESAVLTAEKTTLRRVLPGPAPAWHQDGSFLGGEARTVDVWVALSRCGAGTDSSGLEILPRRLDELVAFGIEGTRTNIEILGDDVLKAGAGVTPVCPTFEPGDALLFDELFLHRTMPGLPRPRYALEIWTFAPSGRTPSYTPLAL
jgi:hypothetical protein